MLSVFALHVLLGSVWCQDVLDKLLTENSANFACICKALSECGSAMRGGADNGDLGWLDWSLNAMRRYW